MHINYSVYISMFEDAFIFIDTVASLVHKRSVKYIIQIQDIICRFAGDKREMIRSSFFMDINFFTDKRMTEG